jgi:hypothetical protein
MIMSRVWTSFRSALSRLASVLILTLSIPVAAAASDTDIWVLTQREYPVLPETELRIDVGRNAGSYIKIERFGRRNAVSYINSSMVRGEQECLAVSSYEWSDAEMPERIVAGTDVYVQLAATIDRSEGAGCGTARIGVAYGNRDEPLLDTASNVIAVSQLQASPFGNPGATAAFRVMPGGNTGPYLFTVAVYVTDGGTVRRVVALYIYEMMRSY